MAHTATPAAPLLPQLLLRRLYDFAFGFLPSAMLTLLAAIGLLMSLSHRFLTPRPAAPTPKLIENTLELTLAEIESEHPSKAATTATGSTSVAPQSEQAAYLLDAASSLALPPPPKRFTAHLPQHVGQPIPELPLPELKPTRQDLPEITLPPAQPFPEPIVAPSPPQVQSSAPPAQAAAGQTARLKKPRMISNPALLKKSYPPEARRNGWEGTVILKLEINAQGRVEALSIHQSSGYRVLDRAAEKSIRSARFTDGPGKLLQTIHFSLRE